VTTDGEGRDVAVEAARRRRRRSVAIGLALAAVVVLFYVLTVLKLGPGVFDRPL
jgi:hypothetical protein